MNQVRKLEKVAKLHVMHLAMLSLDQVCSLMCVIKEYCSTKLLE
jgi:hypothetical protein